MTILSIAAGICAFSLIVVVTLCVLAPYDGNLPQ